MQELSGKDVFDVVVRLPKTLGSDASVAQARAALQDDHVHMLLITDDEGRLLGTITRDDLTGLDSGAPALQHAVLRDRTIDPATPAAEALRLMTARGERRRAVVDHDGHLLGLLCVQRRLSGFCSDADARARKS